VSDGPAGVASHLGADDDSCPAEDGDGADRKVGWQDRRPIVEDLGVVVRSLNVAMVCSVLSVGCAGEPEYRDDGECDLLHLLSLVEGLARLWVLTPQAKNLTRFISE
jgi:hypothetical protein